MEEYDIPSIKTTAIDFSRFKVGTKLNNRQGILSLFCDKLRSAIDNPRDPLTEQLVAIKMAHLSEDELRDIFYDIEKKARNFIAYWKWCFMPKKGN